MPTTTTDQPKPLAWVGEAVQLCQPAAVHVLLMLETTDLVFAVDSVPAVLAITTDPFIVYASNVFAILGLRSMFFALAGVMRLFHHLHYGLAAVLVFVGAKMLLAGCYQIPALASLLVIVGLLAAAVAASWLFPRPTPAERNRPLALPHAENPP